LEAEKTNQKKHLVHLANFQNLTMLCFKAWGKHQTLEKNGNREKSLITWTTKPFRQLDFCTPLFHHQSRLPME